MKKITLLLLSALLLLTACGREDAPTVQTPESVTQQEQDTPTTTPAVPEVTETTPAPSITLAETPDISQTSPPTPKTPQETEPVSSVSEPTSESVPVLAPVESAPQEPAVPEPIPAPEPEPVWEPVPVVSGDIYSAAEAAQAGDEYARAQYGVTIDTSMTAESASYFPGTADSVAWLTSNGGQAALNGAARGNVDATFAALAAMDGAETVSIYARFHCTVRYNAASDEYIVVVLYG